MAPAWATARPRTTRSTSRRTLAARATTSTASAPRSWTPRPPRRRRPSRRRSASTASRCQPPSPPRRPPLASAWCAGRRRTPGVPNCHAVLLVGAAVGLALVGGSGRAWARSLPPRPSYAAGAGRRGAGSRPPSLRQAGAHWAYRDCVACSAVPCWGRAGRCWAPMQGSLNQHANAARPAGRRMRRPRQPQRLARPPAPARYDLESAWYL